MNYLKKLDQFGVLFTPHIEKKEQAYRSALGGLVSLILYSVGLAYFIYKIDLWQTNQILPAISNSQATNDYMNITLSEQTVQFTLTTTTGINPFDPNNLILVPIQMTIVNGNLTKFFPLNIVSSNTSTSIIIPSNLELVLNSRESITDNYPNSTTDQFILFSKCNPNLLSGYQELIPLQKNLRCASEQLKQQYFDDTNGQLYLTLLIKQFDVVTKGFNTIKKNIYVQVDPALTLYAQVLLQITEQVCDTGILFDDLSSSTYPSNFQFITQTLTSSYAQLMLNQQVYSYFGIRLDSIKFSTQITYPKLGQILADVGSIISTLFTLKFLMVMLNQYMMLDQFYMQIISYYYPNIKLLKIKKSLLGKVVKVQFNGQDISNVKEVSEYLQDLKNKAATKLTLLNQIYEISRLQFMIQSLQTKEFINESHNKGIKLKFEQYNGDSLEINELHREDQIKQIPLNDSDFNILSLDHQKDRDSELPHYYCNNRVRLMT